MSTEKLEKYIAEANLEALDAFWLPPHPWRKAIQVIMFRH